MKTMARWLRTLADWCDPPVVRTVSLLEVAASAGVLQAERLYPETSGEYKRHQVYAQLIKAFPGETKRAIALAIEQALQ